MSNVYFSILRCAGVAALAAICLLVPVRARGEPAGPATEDSPARGEGCAAGQARDVSKPGKSGDVADSTVGFFEDGRPTEVAELETLPEDRFFDRYVPLEGLAAAWETADSQELSALAIETAEAERILLRSRHGLPTDVIWRAAIRVAHARADKQSLQRLAGAAKRLGKEEYRKPLEAALALAGTSRAADEAIAVNPLDVTEEEYAVLQVYSRNLTAAAARGDKQYLRDFDHNLEALFLAAPTLRDLIRGFLKYLIETTPDEPLDPKAAMVMQQLLVDSRGGLFKGGGIKISTPKIGGSVGKWWEEKVKKPVTGGADRLGENISGGWERLKENVKDPRIDIHDIRRAGKKAREDIQRFGKDAREHVQREAVRARKEIGRPWNRNVRDPWVAWLERQYNSGQAGLDAVQRKFDEARSGLPMLVYGKDATYRNLPGGNFQPQRFGNVLVSASTRGTVGYPIIYYYYYYGWNLRCATRFKVRSGSARLVIKRNDGAVAADSGWRSAPFFGRLGFDTTLPRVPGGTSFKTKDGFGGKYLVAVELSPNSQVDLWYLAYWRPDKSYYDPDKLFSKMDQIVEQTQRLNLTRQSGNHLVGRWQTQGRVATFHANGTCTVQTSAGTKTFRYNYEPASRTLVGTDAQGQQTRTRIRWLGPNSIQWVSPSGSRQYVRRG